MADTSSPRPRRKTTGRRVVQGIVTRDKMAKTRRVEVERLVRHPKYGKFVKRRTVCYVHDEKNESHLGDTVEIIESRPLSKLKRWELVKVVKKAPSRTLSNLEGAVAGARRRPQAAAGEAGREEVSGLQIDELRLTIEKPRLLVFNRQSQICNRNPRGML